MSNVWKLVPLRATGSTGCCAITKRMFFVNEARGQMYLCWPSEDLYHPKRGSSKQIQGRQLSKNDTFNALLLDSKKVNIHIYTDSLNFSQVGVVPR